MLKRVQLHTLYMSIEHSYGSIEVMPTPNMATLRVYLNIFYYVL